ncbi:unnamed protein product [Macrosiphum euphorbiae]|uniref:Uncharacterized protein n=1 Tax=Macrosiphum euphorbiae TaxID=13131 RepID=A0AAV0VWA3_9HEMI|nr:unnamed protein product [Macrosiphum euphorbiae]
MPSASSSSWLSSEITDSDECIRSTAEYTAISSNSSSINPLGEISNDLSIIDDLYLSTKLLTSSTVSLIERSLGSKIIRT